MGNPEEAAVTAPGWRLSKKVGYILAFLAVAAVVIVGLMTYYIGVMNACSAKAPQTAPPSPSKPKVKSKGLSKILLTDCI